MSKAELRAEIVKYSREQYEATEFADAVCGCSSAAFHLHLDDNEGCAVRVCTACDADHFIGDSEDYLEDAELWQAVCTCEAAMFEITVGVALYADSEDVRWLYIGCRCLACGLAGVYGDWKNEHPGYRELLARV